MLDKQALLNAFNKNAPRLAYLGRYDTTELYPGQASGAVQNGTIYCVLADSPAEPIIAKMNPSLNGIVPLRRFTAILVQLVDGEWEVNSVPTKETLQQTNGAGYPNTVSYASVYVAQDSALPNQRNLSAITGLLKVTAGEPSAAESADVVNTITNGTLPGAKLVANSVTSTEIGAGAVTSSELAANSVGTTNLQDECVNTNKITNLGGTPDGKIIKSGVDLAVFKSNYTATVNPTANDDVDDGYGVNSEWMNVTTQEEFVCTSNTAGAAVWKSRTAAGSTVDLSSPPPIGDVAPNTGAFTSLTASTATVDGSLQVTDGAGVYTFIEPGGFDVTSEVNTAIPTRRFFRTLTGGASVTSGTVIGVDEYNAFGGSSLVPVAETRAVATQTHTTTAKGVKWVLRLIRNGTAALYDALTVDHDGKLINIVRGLSQSPVGTVAKLTAPVTVNDGSTFYSVLTGFTTAEKTLPANNATVGTRVSFEGYGYATINGAETSEVRLSVGGAAVVTAPFTPVGNVTNGGFSIRGSFTVITTGASGTLRGAIEVFGVDDDGATYGGCKVSTTTTTINTTIDRLIDISAASFNSLTFTDLSLRIEN